MKFFITNLTLHTDLNTKRKITYLLRKIKYVYCIILVNHSQSKKYMVKTTYGKLK